MDVKTVEKKGKAYKGLKELCDENLQDLFKAILNVRSAYYTYSTKNFAINKKDVQEQLERVFAYELYHQWSKRLEEHHNWDTPLTINGEIGKRVEDALAYPDLVLHKGQDQNDNQEIAVEIKRQVSITETNVLSDLRKLSNLLKCGKLEYGAAPFKHAVFILTGGCVADILPFFKHQHFARIDNRILCVFCSGEGKLDYTTIEKLKKENNV